jgi:queuine tRNA-ribosyltransferase
MPTRNARNGMLFTAEGKINIRNKKWESDFNELDPNGSTWVDHHYTRAYLRHLIISNEILGAQIASVHNIGFYLQLVREARKQIINGTYFEWKNEMAGKLDNRL